MTTIAGLMSWRIAMQFFRVRPIPAKSCCRVTRVRSPMAFAMEATATPNGLTRKACARCKTVRRAEGHGRKVSALRAPAHRRGRHCCGRGSPQERLADDWAESGGL